MGAGMADRKHLLSLSTLAQIHVLHLLRVVQYVLNDLPASPAF